MCPQYFYRLRIMCFYRGDRDIHLIGDFLIRKIPFQLIQTDLAFLLRASDRSLGKNETSYLVPLSL